MLALLRRECNGLLEILYLSRLVLLSLIAARDQTPLELAEGHMVTSTYLYSLRVLASLNIRPWVVFWTARWLVAVSGVFGICGVMLAAYFCLSCWDGDSKWKLYKIPILAASVLIENVNVRIDILLLWLRYTPLLSRKLSAWRIFSVNSPKHTRLLLIALYMIVPDASGIVRELYIIIL